MSVHPHKKIKESTYKHPERERKRCPDCKFRVRGQNHEKGSHHKGK